MAVYAGLIASVPHMNCRPVHSIGAHPSPSRVLDTRYVLRVTSVPKHALHSLCRSCVTTASLHILTIPALSLKLKSRKIKNQFLLSYSSLGGGNLPKLVRPQGYPSRSRQKSHAFKAQVTELVSGIEVINNLGLDTLTFLGATVVIVPTFKAIKQSPIFGFLSAGVLLNQLELIRSVTMSRL